MPNEVTNSTVISAEQMKANSNIKVLGLCVWDWANTGYRTLQCIKRLGFNIIGLKGELHHFNYPRQITPHYALSKIRVFEEYPVMVDSSELSDIIAKADVLHFFASTFVISRTPIADKKVIVQHGGSTYRNKPEASNEVFNPFVTATIAQFQTLMGYGAVNESLIYYPVDTEYIQPSFKQDEYPIVIGHFPSTAKAKGSDTIIGVCEDIKARYGDKVKLNISTSRVDWKGNLDRIRECDIIIETVKPVLGDKPFCEWGNMCLESAASGKVVITNCYSTDTYTREYGTKFVPCVANSLNSLYTALDEIVSLGPAFVKEQQLASRNWAHIVHGMDATSLRLWDKVYSKLV